MHEKSWSASPPLLAAARGSRYWSRISTRLLAVSVWLLFAAVVLAPILDLYVRQLLTDFPGWARAVEEALISPRAGALAGRTFSLAAVVCVLSAVIALPYGLLVARGGLVGAGFLRVAMLLPLATPAYLNSVALISLTGPNGLLSKALRHVAPNASVPALSGFWAAAVALAVGLWPIMGLLVSAAARTADADLDDAARLERGGLRHLLFAVLPPLLPALGAGVLLIFMLAAQDFGVPDLMGVKVYSVEVFSEVSAEFNLVAAATRTLPLLAACVVVLFLLWAAVGRASFGTWGAAAREPTPLALGRGRYVATTFLALVVGGTWVLPFLVLVARSLAPHAYAKAWVAMAPPLYHSLAFSAQGATLMLAIGLLCAYTIERSGKTRTAAGELLCAFPLAVPGILVGLGMISVYDRPGLLGYLYRTPLMVVLAYVAQFITFAALPSLVLLRAVDRSVQESAQVEGADGAKALRFILVPLLWRGIGAIWALCFLLCLREVSATVLLQPPGTQTLSLAIFDLMHYGADAQVAAMCVVLNLLVLGAAVVGGSLLWGLGRRRR